MIDWIKSAELNNCDVESLKAWTDKYPKSGKKVVANCNNCDKERKLSFSDYCGDNCDLCHKCANGTSEMVEANRLRGIKQYSDQKARDEQRDRLLQWNKDHPEAGKSHSEWLIEYCNDLEILKMYSERGIQSHIDHSGLWDNANENMKGGQDIVKHHTIYDYSDLLKHTMPMTRSIHQMLHRLFQKHGIEIPHINKEV